MRARTNRGVIPAFADHGHLFATSGSILSRRRCASKHLGNSVRTICSKKRRASHSHERVRYFGLLICLSFFPVPSTSCSLLPHFHSLSLSLFLDLCLVSYHCLSLLLSRCTTKHAASLQVATLLYRVFAAHAYRIKSLRRCASTRHTAISLLIMHLSLRSISISSTFAA